MKRALAVVLVLAATAALALNPLGKIVATDAAAKNQTDTAAAFGISSAAIVFIQCDNPAYVKPVASGAVTASDYSVKLAKDQPATIKMGGATGNLTLLSVLGVTASTTVTCYVSEVVR